MTPGATPPPHLPSWTGYQGEEPSEGAELINLSLSFHAELFNTSTFLISLFLHAFPSFPFLPCHSTASFLPLMNLAGVSQTIPPLFLEVDLREIPLPHQGPAGSQWDAPPQLIPTAKVPLGGIKGIRGGSASALCPLPAPPLPDRHTPSHPLLTNTRTSDTSICFQTTTGPVK